MSVDVQSTPIALEPGAQMFADAVSKPPFLSDLGPEKGREALDQVQTEAHAARPDVTIEDMIVAGGPTGQINVRVMRPTHLTGELPVILYTHGAGWVLAIRSPTIA
jgi:acetyl esterase